MGATKKDLKVAEKFKRLLQKHQISVIRTIVFGSRARGDADSESDLDILVVIDDKTPEIGRKISDCAWEVGFDAGMVIQPVVMTTRQLQGPEKSSLLMLAVDKEGISV